MTYRQEGIGVVNPTPQNPDGSINEAEYRRLASWLADCGIGFIQPMAGIGQYLESSFEEYARVLKITAEEIGKRVAVTAYVAHPDPRRAIELIDAAQTAGAHSAFVMAPFFSLPDQEGVYLFYKEIAKNTTLPLVLYNAPGRQGINVSVDVLERLANEFSNFVGCKTTNIAEFPQTYHRLAHKFHTTVGADQQVLNGFALGAKGQLMFAATLIPEKLVAMLRAWGAGDIAKAREIYLQCLPLLDVIHVEPVPNAIFYVLSRMGWNLGKPRLPAHELSDANKKKVDKVLASLGMISG